MVILILQAGDNHVDLYKAVCNLSGTKYKFKEQESLTFDGRVKAPKKNLMRRTLSWVNERSGTWVKIIIIPGGSLTQLLTRKIRERALFSELLQPQYKDPSVVLTRFAHKIRSSSIS